MNYWEAQNESHLVSGDEVLVASCAKAYVYDANKKTKNVSGKLSLSTYHLFFQEGANTKRLPLEYIRRSGQTPSASKGVFGGDKITIPLPADKFCRLVIKDGDMDSFYQGLVSALEKQSWRQAPSLPAVSAAPAVSSSPAIASGVAGTRVNTTATTSGTSGRTAAQVPAPEPAARTANMIGIAGVMQASQQSAQMQSTFHDIDDVMKRASAVVNSIHQLKQRANSGTGENSEADATAIESIEATLGLGTMVRTTSSKSGTKQAQFHEDLAAEMHAWLVHPKNARLFGEMPIITLIELFSLYNKARSGDLVSPDDVLMASRTMSKQSYSRYSCRTLASGRTALVNKDTSILISKLVPTLGPQLTTASGSKPLASTGVTPTKTIPTTTQFPRNVMELKSINAAHLATVLQVPVPVAEDALLELESAGVLCRSDAGFDCYTFYWNVFVF